MNKRLGFKLLPVVLLAAIGIFWAANTPQKAEGVVSGITCSGNVCSFTADGGGSITVAASSGVGLSASCSVGGCAFAGLGGNLLTITPPAGTALFTVTLTLSCTSIGVPVVVSATQGATTTSASTFLTGCTTFGGFSGLGCDGLLGSGFGGFGTGFGGFGTGFGGFGTGFGGFGTGFVGSNCFCPGFGSNAL